ncbi:hypothetical protein LTR86_002051 [Recurvomyces mirabilis]|nr:hypothetical protein LTR86_002051 [Recurvomyces mirabilis]
MQNTARIVRRSCRATHAYNVSAALCSAFSTTATHAAASGSFASYDTILDQLSSPKHVKESKTIGSSKQQRIIKVVDQGPSQSRGLQARQDAVERQLKQSPASKEEPLPKEGPSPKEEPSPKDEPSPIEQTRNDRKAHVSIRKVGKLRRNHSKENRVVDRQGGSDEQNALSSNRSTKPVHVDDEARQRCLSRLENEQPKAVSAAEQTAGDWISAMHWIAKTVVSISKDKTFNWRDRQLVRQVRRLLDYDAISLPPISTPVQQAMPLPWALSADQISKMQPMEVLDEEIKRFAVWAQPSPAEQLARQAVVDQTLQFINQKLDQRDIKLQAEIFGSESTGLALAASDIDIRIFDASSSDDEGRYSSLNSPMRQLLVDMRNSGEYICTTFRFAKFPIINAQHRATGIDIQIVSAPSTVRQQGVTEQYLAEMPLLKDLYLVTRMMLGQRNLVDVFNGGIGSYGLFIMLAGALKRRRSHPPTSAGEQLLQFMEMYGQKLDYTRFGLTVNTTQPAKLFLKHQHLSQQQAYIRAAHRRGDDVRAGQWAICTTRQLQHYLLCLQDPADPTNDLGRKSNGIKFIQGTCGALAEELRSGLAGIEKGSGFGGSLLEPVVGRCHEVLAAQRQRVSDFGREVGDDKDGRQTDASGTAEHDRECTNEAAEVMLDGDERVVSVAMAF